MRHPVSAKSFQLSWAYLATRASRIAPNALNERHLNTKLGFPQALRSSRFEEGLLQPASNRVRAKCPNQPRYSEVAGGIIDALRHSTFREYAMLGLPRIRVVKTWSLSSSG